MASANPTRFTLSPDQVRAYLIRIGHSKPNPEDVSSANNYGLGLLASLQRQHLASVPFENLSVHYSANDHIVSLDPEEVYAKIVTRRRGGYCMENNLLFGILLRSFGFTVYSTGGRVSNDVMHLPGGGYSGWYVATPPPPPPHPNPLLVLLLQGAETPYQKPAGVAYIDFYSPIWEHSLYLGYIWSIS